MGRKHFPRGKTAVIAALVLVLGGFGMVSPRVIPGIDEPYNPAAYYSLTAISWEDSPSPFALRDLAESGGNVYDYTRHIKSILFGDNFKDILAVATSMTQNEVINTTPFTSDIYTETDSALSLLRQGTETIGKQVDISEGNPYLRQGDSDEWEAYNENAYDQRQKQIWLDQSYRQMVEGSQQELAGMENALPWSTWRGQITGHGDCFSSMEPTAAADLRDGWFSCRILPGIAWLTWMKPVSW